ncbi:hypothetical protein HNQ80_002848 [Anaerosolibacter carboniphilus]|uniref:Spore germination protein n=1 Tax=Anaerosolibacter carboniphilus TaxID=1417629 RepID=A0A841KSN3_9FIRM|nr:spore germination protein [Anaerosolibacter carboniphilus]MBB6216744.1 hypothetical protein [Anaerosolibacter carboniphilus]
MRLMDRIKGLFGKREAAKNKIFEYEEFQKAYVSKKLKDNLDYLQRILKGSQDIIYREFSIRAINQEFLLVYVDGMAEKKLLNDQILKSMMVEMNPFLAKEKFTLEEVKNQLVSATEVNEVETFDKLVLALLSGDTLVFMEGSAHGLIVGSKGWESRGVSEPTTEKSVKGPKDCFIETLKNNIVLIRRRIRDPNLAVEMLQVGRRSKTDVAIVYLKGVMRQEIVALIKKRIQQVDTDGLIDSTELMGLIEDHKWTFFPQIQHTERPDRAVAAILEARAAVLVDGSPFALLAPATFSMFLDSPDDYYERAIVSSLIRFTRYLSFFISASLPGVYIAITSFHPGMLPVALALSITGTRVALPFPTVVEMFAMETILEVLHEAGLRLPQAIGQTVGIVGGIVIGQAAVQAGLVSPVVVIIVAMTAITSFTLSSYSLNLTTRVLRIPFMIAGSTLGLYGIMVLWMFLLTHMSSLESFGVGYLEDFSPFRLRDLKDTFIRVPKYLMGKRPEFLKPEDTQRQRTRKKQ